MKQKKCLHKKKIAWFSPCLNNNKFFSKGDYITKDVIPILKNRYDIDIFSKEGESFAGYKTYSYLQFYSLNHKRQYDLTLYNFEDEKFADFIRIHLGLWPGVVLFHSLYVSQDGPEPILNSPWQVVIRAIKDLNNGKSINFSYFDGEFDRKKPFAEREAGYAICPVFFNSLFLSEYDNYPIDTLNIMPNKDRFVLNYPAEIASSQLEEVKNDKLYIAYVGKPTLPYMPDKMLSIAKKMEDSIYIFWMVPESYYNQSKEMIREFRVNNVKLVSGWSKSNWINILAKSHIAAHLLFSKFESLDPFTTLSLACGKFVISTDFNLSETLPKNNLILVDPGLSQERELSVVFKEFYKIRNKIRSSAISLFSAKRIAGELDIILQNVLNYSQIFYQLWNDLHKGAKKHLLRTYLQQREEYGLSKEFQEIIKEMGWDNFAL